MKIEYIDNQSAGAGNGKLVFSEAIFPDGPWSIAIQRASDQKYLTGRSSNPWVGEAFFIQKPGEADTNGNLNIFIGSDIVDSLDQQEQYAVTLKGLDGEPQKARLRINNITYSPSANLDNTAKKSEIEDELETTSEPVTPDPPTIAAVDIPEAPIEMPEGELQQKTAQTNQKFWRFGLIALLILGCIAWFIFDPRNKENETAVTQETSQNPEISNPQEEKQSANKNNSPKMALSADEQVKLFFNAKELTPKAAVELAAKLPKTTRADQDALYRLYYFAAENNQPELLLEYGACLDPSKPQWGTIQKNAPEAFNAYQKALAKNPQNAKDAQEKLLDWLHGQANSGNAQARIWLEEISR